MLKLFRDFFSHFYRLLSGDEAATFVEAAVMKLLRERLVLKDFGGECVEFLGSNPREVRVEEEDVFPVPEVPRVGSRSAGPPPPTNPEYRAKPTAQVARASARVAEDSVYMDPRLCPPDRMGGQPTAPLRPMVEPPRNQPSYADPTRNPSAFFDKGDIPNVKGKEVRRGYKTWR